MLDFQWVAHLTDWFSQLLASDLEDLLRLYGYHAIVFLTFLEGETIVIIAGILAAKGMLNPWVIALCAFAGSFTSDQIMFSLGKYKGVSLINRFPRLGRNVDQAARLLKKYDTALILGFRFVYGVRNVTPILLGVSGVSHRKFFILNFIGAAVWAAAFTAGGYFSGKMFGHIMERIGHTAVYAIGGLAVIGVIWWLIRRKKNPPPPPRPYTGKDILPLGTPEDMPEETPSKEE